MKATDYFINDDSKSYINESPATSTYPTPPGALSPMESEAFYRRFDALDPGNTSTMETPTKMNQSMNKPILENSTFVQPVSERRKVSDSTTGTNGKKEENASTAPTTPRFVHEKPQTSFIDGEVDKLVKENNKLKSALEEMRNEYVKTIERYDQQLQSEERKNQDLSGKLKQESDKRVQLEVMMKREIHEKEILEIEVKKLAAKNEVLEDSQKHMEKGQKRMEETQKQMNELLTHYKEMTKMISVKANETSSDVNTPKKVVDHDVQTDNFVGGKSSTEKNDTCLHKCNHTNNDDVKTTNETHLYPEFTYAFVDQEILHLYKQLDLEAVDKLSKRDLQYFVKKTMCDFMVNFKDLNVSIRRLAKFIYVCFRYVNELHLILYPGIKMKSSDYYRGRVYRNGVIDEEMVGLSECLELMKVKIQEMINRS